MADLPSRNIIPANQQLLPQVGSPGGAPTGGTFGGGWLQTALNTVGGAMDKAGESAAEKYRIDAQLAQSGLNPILATGEMKQTGMENFDQTKNALQLALNGSPDQLFNAVGGMGRRVAAAQGGPLMGGDAGVQGAMPNLQGTFDKMKQYYNDNTMGQSLADYYNMRSKATRGETSVPDLTQAGLPGQVGSSLNDSMQKYAGDVRNQTAQDKAAWSKNADETRKMIMEQLAVQQATGGGGKKSKVKGAGAGALQGAAMGAQIGSIVPGIGTGIGAGVGAIAGGLKGLFS